MQEETVAFRLDVSDESIKRNTMKVVWKFPGVTFVDIKEKGQVKVRGNFDKYVMGTTLQEIDKSVDFIKPMGQLEQNYKYVISSFSSVFISVPKVQEIVVILEFEVLDERIKLEAMEVIWEFSGITSVEVVKNRLLKVTGENFNKVEMRTTLKRIDKSVKIAKPEVKQINPQLPNKQEKAKVQAPVNKNLPQGRGFGAEINLPPPNKQEKPGFVGNFWRKVVGKQAKPEGAWGIIDREDLKARHCPPPARLADSSTSKTGETSQMQTQGSRGNSSYLNSNTMGNSYWSTQLGSQRTSSQYSQTGGSMRDQRSQQTVNQGRGGNSVKSSNNLFTYND